MILSSYRRLRPVAGFMTALLGLAFVAAQAQANPNFSGEWKLNPSKSEFGPMPAPASRTDKIAHDDPGLKITTTQSGPNGDNSFNLKYATDGSETTNEVRGNPVKSTSKWDGDALVVNSKASFGGADITLLDKWVLSDDGKVLTISRHITSPQGELDMKMVLQKQ